ncbi:hypothetical protein KTT_10290 [Tengunoibacter tsumagoiensis]|uniref:Uncharacterized protein n=1 Tax=Tengunoibacter tsumagoiensis TaxID=2014871 RepID=A0A401ZWL4_9CHLR|nr:hypothetical protein KTT_10290 [Tengunoibacter tsumagoiensis]
MSLSPAPTPLCEPLHGSIGNDAMHGYLLKSKIFIHKGRKSTRYYSLDKEISITYIFNIECNYSGPLEPLSKNKKTVTVER